MEINKLFAQLKGIVISMKKILSGILAVISIVSLSGCQKLSNKTESTTTENSTGSTTSQSTEVATQALKIEDYFPIKENVKYIYEGNGNEYASYSKIIDYTSQNKVQHRINNGGTEIIKVFELKDGKVTMLLSKPETYYRENFLNNAATDQEVILMEPLKVGTSWTLSNNYTRKINKTSVEVTVPAGKYNAIEVITEGPKDKTIDYYASGIGLIKSVYTTGDKQSEVSSSLSKIEQNTPFVQSVRFFYPDINKSELFSVDKDISFNTNDMTNTVFETAYKQVNDKSNVKVLTENTKINSLYLNSDNIVCIDLNKSFIAEMNAGSEYESMILQSITNTFGMYYGTDKVIITIDGNPYESGHIAMKKGEYLKVNY